MARTSRHLVVDGSNIATEGRTVPSLAQLDDAVRAIQAEEPDRQITVIVDATFAHRIDESERSTFEDASNNGEILMPPAGAVGRGDAFILQVAEKADAAVLSNDSFQEFHGEHPWLFDEDRLIGGKPVEGIGWVFVARVPVRGPASRRATREAKKGRGRTATKKAGRSRTSKEAEGPPPVPTSDTPPPGRGRGRGRRRGDKASASASTDDSATTGTATKKAAAKATKKSTKKSGSSSRGRGRNLEELNSPEDFLRFVTRHSIGDEVEAVVERYSSHGCYVGAAGAQCYLPSSAMGDPPPTKARDVVSIGQTAIVRVESLDSDRRGINVELVRAVTEDGSRQNPPGGPSRRTEHNQTSQHAAAVADDTAGEANPTRSDTTVATKKAAKKSAKKAAKKSAKKATKKAPAKATTSARAAKATARKATKKTAKKATKKTTAKKATKKTAKKAAKKTTKKAAKKAPAKKTAKKTTKKATKKAPAKKTAKKATKKATKKAPAKKTTKKTTKKVAKKR